MKIPCNIRDQ